MKFNLLSSKNSVLSEQLFSSLFNFITPIFIGYAYTSDDVSLYFLIFNFSLIPLAIVRAIIFLPYTIGLAFDSDKEDKGVNSMVFLTSFIIFALFLVVLFVYLWSSFSQQFGSAMFVNAAIMFLYLVWREFIRGYILATGAYVPALRFTFTSCCVVVLSALLGFWLKLSLSAVFSVSFLYLFYATVSLAKRQKVSIKRPSHSLLKQYYGFGKSSLYNNLLQTVLMQVLLTQVSRQWGALAVGIFGVTNSLANLASPMYQAANTYMAKSTADIVRKLGERAGWEYTQRALLKMLIVGGVYVSGITLVGPIAQRYLYSAELQGEMMAYFFLSVNFCAQGLGFPISRFFNAIQSPNEILRSGIVYGVAFAFFATMMLSYAVTGFCAAIAISRVLALAYQGFIFARYRNNVGN